MKFHRITPTRAALVLGFSASSAVALVACGGGGGGSSMTPSTPQISLADAALVVDNKEVVAVSATVDANLQNPWGIAMATGLPFWIANNNGNTATLYTGTGVAETSAVTGSATVGIAIPASAAGVAANPTGQVYNGNGGFTITTGSGAESALFIFAGEGGTIAGWAKDSGAAAATAYDDGVANGTAHAVYKGLALGAVGSTPYIYATDLHNNKVDVFDTTFQKPAAMQGKFVDPTMPAGFAPFGITALNGQLYVTYAMQDAAKHDEMTGAGMGYVDIFDFSGNFVSRFATAGSLNAPWGIAVAPTAFGSIAGDVLIGNFGDGKINIFTPKAGALATSNGSLMANNGQAFVFPGLWSLVFGNGDADKPVGTLFYTAGFADQTDGVFGTITASVTTAPTGGY
jgi:uncharacterized protein (TIGR03118 family)